MFRRSFAAGAAALAALGLSACGGDSVTNLGVGDCFTESAISDNTAVTNVPTVDCTQPHEYEVIGTHTHEGGDWPGAAAVEIAAYEACAAEFESYVGSLYATSSILLVPMNPTEEGWAGGDRESLCLAQTETRSSSVEGSGE